MQWCAFITIIALIIVHGIWPEKFLIDKFSMSLVGLLAIPLLFPFLKKAKWFGAEFEFKEHFLKTKQLVEESEKQAQLAHPKDSQKEVVFNTFDLKRVKQVLEIDPNLSLAALRIEIERVLTQAYRKFSNSSGNEKIVPLKKAIEWLQAHDYLTEPQRSAIKEITEICNKAVHGAEITTDQAGQIIDLTEQLNNSFPCGYSINLDPNSNFRKNGYICEWEHCIEYSPFGEHNNLASCPIYGHDCPGGEETRKLCKQKI